jgi:hypothetical protein
MGKCRHFAALISALLLGLLLVPQANAHGTTITFAIFGDGEGRVRAAGTWGKDLHRVEEQMWVVLTATPVPADSGRSAVGPLVMLPVDGETAVVQAPQLLGPGRWNVVVEASHPAFGKGEAQVDVGGQATGFPEHYTPPVPDPGRTWLLWPLAIIVPVVAALFIRRRPRMQQVDRSAD